MVNTSGGDSGNSSGACSRFAAGLAGRSRADRRRYCVFGAGARLGWGSRRGDTVSPSTRAGGVPSARRQLWRGGSRPAGTRAGVNGHQRRRADGTRVWRTERTEESVHYRHWRQLGTPSTVRGLGHRVVGGECSAADCTGRTRSTARGIWVPMSYFCTNTEN